MSGEISAAANAIGASCGTSSASSSSSTTTNRIQANGGVTGSLQNGSLSGGSIGTPLSGLNG